MLGFLTQVPLQQQTWEKHLEEAECLQNSIPPAQLTKEHAEAQISGSCFFLSKNIFLANSIWPSPSAPLSLSLLQRERKSRASTTGPCSLTQVPPAALLLQLLFIVSG